MMQSRPLSTCVSRSSGRLSRLESLETWTTATGRRAMVWLAQWAVPVWMICAPKKVLEKSQEELRALA